MIKPSIYQQQNVLHLIFEDQIQPQHFEVLKRILPAVFRCLRPDFTLLTDLSKVGEIDFACCRHIGELMDQVVVAGVGQVFRVIPDPRKDIGLNILAAFHYPGSLPVKIYSDLSEAMDMLAINQELVFNEPCAGTPIPVY